MNRWTPRKRDAHSAVQVPWAEEPPPTAPWRAEVAWSLLPCPGEFVSGDRAIVQHFADVLHVAVVDVAGHGRHAAQVAEDLDQHMRRQGDLPAASWLYAAHQRLIGSQGAVAAVLRLDLRRGIGEMAAVGNVRSGWFAGKPHHHEPNSGQLGVTMPRVEARPLHWTISQLFALTSDGVRSEGWNALQREWPVLSCDALAARTTRLYQRRHDDATAICVRVVQDDLFGGAHAGG